MSERCGFTSVFAFGVARTSSTLTSTSNARNTSMMVAVEVATLPQGSLVLQEKEQRERDQQQQQRREAEQEQEGGSITTWRRGLGGKRKRLLVGRFESRPSTSGSRSTSKSVGR